MRNIQNINIRYGSGVPVPCDPLHRFRCTSPLCPSASEHDVTVTFWRIGKDQPIKEGALGGENVENSGENQLSERQVLICNMLKVNGENSARSLARILNLSQRTVEREISFLRNHGFIDKDGTKNGVWKVLK